MLGTAMASKRIDQVRLFQNPWLERFTVISLRMFVVIWMTLIPAILFYAWGSATPGVAAGLFGAGLLVWSLTEYALHRFVFHWQPRWQPLARLMFMIHGNHHVAPADPLRNLMPPIISLPVAALVWAACVALIGPAGSWLFAGFIIGYVAYDIIHFGCHQWTAQHRLSGAFKVNHVRHHFSATKGNFAITGMFWDRLFGSRINSLKA
jgi:sterol desaturase/sphingolipid hydroxylase (fatty acid hydroxylase superfamily)